MTNHYIVNATTREIWQDIPEPEQGLNEKRAYESRLRFPYSTELNWRDGQRVEVNVHFQFGWTTGRKDNVDDGHQFQIAIPIKEKGKYMCSECDTLYDNINDGCPKCSQPLPSKDKEEKNSFGKAIDELPEEIRNDLKEWKSDKEEKTERGDWRKELAGYLGYTSFEQLDTAERSIAEWMEKHFKK